MEKKKLKKAMVGISREILCSTLYSNLKTRRFSEKLGDSHENRESLQVHTVCNWLYS